MEQSSATSTSSNRYMYDIDGNETRIKRIKRESGVTAKNIVVLKSDDVARRHDQVFMPNTIEMAYIKKRSMGQFKTKVEFSSVMSEDDVSKKLVENFPLLKGQRFYCASAVDNRTRLEFHGQPRLWNGSSIKKWIKGNSALYILIEVMEPETLIPSHDQIKGVGGTAARFQPTSSSESINQTRAAAINHQAINTSDGKTQQPLCDELSDKLMILDSNEHVTPTQEPMSSQIRSGACADNAAGPGHVMQQALPAGLGTSDVVSDKQKSYPTTGKEAMNVFKVPGHGNMVSGLQLAQQMTDTDISGATSQQSLHSFYITTAASQSECFQTTEAVPWNTQQIHQTKEAPTCRTLRIESCNQVPQMAARPKMEHDESRFSYRDSGEASGATGTDSAYFGLPLPSTSEASESESGFDSSAGNFPCSDTSQSRKTTDDEVEQPEDPFFLPSGVASKIIGLSEDCFSAIDSIISDNDLSGVVKEICPRSGSVKGGQPFLISLSEHLPDEVINGVAWFDGCVAADLEKSTCSTFRGILPAAQQAGPVPVTVQTQAGQYLGMTLFTYVDEVKEILEQLVTDPAMQSQFFKLWAQEGTSNQTKSMRPVDVLQSLVHIAALTNAQQFIHMIFSTSAGKTIFDAYKSRTPLPEDVAKANGHQELAQYLQDITRSYLEESSSCGVQSQVIDWQELVQAVEETQKQPCTEELTSSHENDDNLSDYFADAETSSCGSYELNVHRSDSEDSGPLIKDDDSSSCMMPKIVTNKESTTTHGFKTACENEDIGSQTKGCDNKASPTDCVEPPDRRSAKETSKSQATDLQSEPSPNSANDQWRQSDTKIKKDTLRNANSARQETLNDRFGGQSLSRTIVRQKEGDDYTSEQQDSTFVRKEKEEESWKPRARHNKSILCEELSKRVETDPTSMSWNTYALCAFGFTLVNVLGTGGLACMVNVFCGLSSPLVNMFCGLSFTLACLFCGLSFTLVCVVCGLSFTLVCVVCGLSSTLGYVLCGLGLLVAVLTLVIFVEIDRKLSKKQRLIHSVLFGSHLADVTFKGIGSYYPTNDEIANRKAVRYR